MPPDPRSPFSRTVLRRPRRGRIVALLALSAVAITACGVDHSVRGVRREPATTVSTRPVPTFAPSEPQPELPDDTGDGVGDVLFPDLGNPGLDVRSYDLELHYDRAAHRLTGTEVLTLAVTYERESFTLDSVGLDVVAVAVEGIPAEFVRRDPELEITPTEPLLFGRTYDVRVDWSVATSPPRNPLSAGFYETAQGAVTQNEPAGARTWFPSNDHPSDKALYRFELYVDAGSTAVANGVLAQRPTKPGDPWVWQSDDPLATYLVQFLVGPYEIVETTTSNGHLLVSAVLDGYVDDVPAYHAVTDDQIEFFETLFGPYPLSQYGLAITDAQPGLAIEQQGRSMFSDGDLDGAPVDPWEAGLLAHELAHQWFGDAVSPARWQDIWLNESFATYAEWLWTDHSGASDLSGRAAEALRQRRVGSVSTGEPSAQDMFGFEVYDGGAVVLHALRLTIGDEAFFRLLQRWVEDYSGTSRSTEDFHVLAEQVSGTSLIEFFDTWLYARRIPDAYPLDLSVQ